MSVGNQCDYIFSTQENVSSYMQRVFIFLDKHRWIYDLQLTHYFVEKAWSNIPVEWNDVLANLSVDEMHAIPDGYVQNTWPVSLKAFIEEAQELSVLQHKPSVDIVPVAIKQQLKRGMCPKKVHEVENMAAVISELHRDHQHSRSLVVDVGSGLGYLGQVLSSHCQLRTLGLESKDAYAHSAVNRAKLRDVSGPGFKSVAFELYDNEKCFSDFQHLLKSHALDYEDNSQGNVGQEGNDGCSIDCETKINRADAFCEPEDMLLNKSSATKTEMSDANTSGCGNSPMLTSLVGLHCCGDLTPTMLRLFTATPDLHNLVCVSCCYHRMTHRDGTFKYFPMSNILKDTNKAFLESHPEWNMSIFALRLASQETRERWKTQTEEDHNFHTKNVAYRSILEVFFAESGRSIQKTKRKMANRRAYNNFEDYIHTVVERVTLEGQEAKNQAKGILRQLYQDYEPYFKYIESFTCLQVMMQPVLESLILMDRVAYLREEGLNATLRPVMIDHISPRNMAIITRK